MPNSKNTLDIRLAESVVFLRGGDGTGRRRAGETLPNAPPALVRGLLTLNLAKPTKISSIEVELLCKTSMTLPDGVGARRVDVTEDHKIFSQTYTFYKAGSTPSSHRRHLSIGPGLHLDHYRDEEHDDESADVDDSMGDEPRGRGRTRNLEPSHIPRRASADTAHFQPNYVSHHQEQMSTPPYTPMLSPLVTPLHSPAPSFHSPLITEDSSLDEFRRVLNTSRTEHGGISDRSASRHTSLLGTSAEGSLSRRVSLDEHQAEFVVGSSRHHSHSHIPTIIHHHNPHHTSSLGHDDRGRKHKRTGLASVLFDAVVDRVRSVSRAAGGDVTPPRSQSRNNSQERREGSSTRGRTREPREPRSTLERVNEVQVVDGEEMEYGDGWREFRKGTYTYPISFAIPANSPPTLAAEFGSVVWKLKAYAHRPGTFKTKLSASQEVTVVTCPGEDDIEDSDNILVERQWETQMQYLLAISGRSFPIGGTIPFSITFMPFTKMKIFRLSMVLEERVDYYSDFKRLVRTDPITRLVLFTLKDIHKTHPLLPLVSDDIEAFKYSPLYALVRGEEDLSEAVSTYMGPGPWTIHKNVELPKSCSDLHFTNKNKKANILVTHTLKVIFRVQRGDDVEIDPQTGKRKLFDIVVQTPIHILSCLCRPDYISLPPYSELPASIGNGAPTVTTCQCGRSASSLPHARYTTPAHSPADSGYLTGTDSTSPSASRSNSSYFTAPTAAPSIASALSSDSVLSSPVSQRSPPVHLDTVFELGNQFERLISGHESEMGEAPPSYAEAALQGSRTPRLVHA